MATRSWATEAKGLLSLLGSVFLVVLAIFTGCASMQGRSYSF